MTNPFDYNDNTTNNEWLTDDEDDEAYDAKNDETFGDSCLENGDWEHDHEILAKITELSRQNSNQKNDDTGELSKKVASCILDDDGPEPTTSRSPKQPTSDFFDSVNAKFPPFVNFPAKMCYVEDIERNIRDRMNTPVPNSSRQDELPLPLVNTRRAEDIERDLPQALLGIVKPQIQPASHLPTVQQVPVSRRPNNPPPFVTAAPPQALQVINSVYCRNSVLPIMPPNQAMGHPPNQAMGHPPNQALGHPPNQALGHPPNQALGHPPNQALRRPSMTHNGLTSVQMGRGLPPPPHNGTLGGVPNIVNQQFGFQQARMFFPAPDHPPQPQQPPPPASLSLFHMPPPQLQQRNRQYNDAYSSWRPNNPPADVSNVDEYAGLMTEHDKNWLAQIQMLQLNNLHPYQDDYYFTMHQSRQQGTGARSKLGGPNINKMSREPQATKTYTPQQFENSLGKLQVGSVTAPRKIIDTDVVESVNPSENHCTNLYSPQEAGAAARSSSTSAASSSSTFSSVTRIKAVLLEIEMLYTLVLKGEDFLHPLSGVVMEEGCNPYKLFNDVAKRMLRDNKLLLFIASSKGKKLLLRVMPHLTMDLMEEILRVIVYGMTLLSRKDIEQCMLQLLPYIRKWIMTLNFSTLVDIAKMHDSDTNYILTNTFTISVLANMIERAETILENTTDYKDSEVVQWFNFIEKFVNNCPPSIELERPVVALEASILHRHLDRNRLINPSSSNSDRTSNLIKALCIITDVNRRQ
ncbi:protein associated with topo II related - 1 [Lycorma delicatula]|uniref:protein associated with topo II related - 1 n=1 Tax=Lycorma delicatula TaxID=130591 RepID=UPI003F50FC59